MESATISSINLDNGLTDYFDDSEYEASYAGIDLKPFAYQDDVTRVADSVESAQAGLTRFETLAESKCLDYNPDKSSYIVFGKKKVTKEIEKELKMNPLILYKHEMKRDIVVKYLGDQVSDEDVASSILKTMH